MSLYFPAMSEKVRQRQDARREAVLAAAARVFAARGYQTTSMHDLAAEVGLTKPSLYHYVRSKEEVLVTLYESVLRDSTAAVAAIEAAATTAHAALREVVVERVAYTCENQALLRVFFEEEAGLPREQLKDVLQARRAYEDAVIALAVRASADGVLELRVPVRIYVNTLLGAANWVYKWYDPDGRLTPRELGDQVASVLLGAPSGGV